MTAVKVGFDVLLFQCLFKVLTYTVYQHDAHTEVIEQGDIFQQGVVLPVDDTVSRREDKRRVAHRTNVGRGLSEPINIFTEGIVALCTHRFGLTNSGSQIQTHSDAGVEKRMIRLLSTA